MVALALDIDDTIADTVHYFTQKLNERYGNPYGLNTDELIQKYKILPRMHFWQQPDIIAWLEQQALTNEVQESIDRVPGSLEVVKDLSNWASIVYMTARFDVVKEGTRNWLIKHGFPSGELIMRPPENRRTNGNVWKAAILEKRLEDIVGIVEDNPDIIPALSPHYQGTVLLFGHQMDPYESKHILVRPCPTWVEVHNESKKIIV